MKEIHDSKTGAILFKSDESDPIDKRIKVLENKVFRLTNEVNRLSQIIEKYNMNK